MLSGVTPIPVRSGASPIAISDLTGTNLHGEPAAHELTRNTHATLLLFVSSTCNGCQELFEASHTPAMLGLQGEDALLFVFKEGGGGVTGMAEEASVIVSDRAWRDYGVTGPPFFCFVDPTKVTVLTEGVAWGASAVHDAVVAARAGAPSLEVGRLTLPPSNES